MHKSIRIYDYDSSAGHIQLNDPYYYVILLKYVKSISINVVEYKTVDFTVLFLTPYQLLNVKLLPNSIVKVLQFHADFYCIEYHKKEVACNGVLFNNIFERPLIDTTAQFFEETHILLEQVEKIQQSVASFDLSIMKAYLQLILALCNREMLVHRQEYIHTSNNSLSDLRNLINENFIQQRSIQFYADYYNMNVNSFSKRVKQEYGKSPLVLIQERLILEAKKLLHLTYKSIKEIAVTLAFEDVFYFSRFFKKHVGVSPKKFREEVGIAGIAEKSID
ncbi:helix-turn-helix domain-containing protein [Sphingobacterium composti Ten et al. 2007 non Yoo et al. 2007]|uniref:helix-turn-helix domain-containing protein n=1 Tax=Sphingobacterium composti TaxID=363260 RepID=UPI00135CF689|nr:AraC family transcriptional regulator [Sphingobacterium composti Ten et al. 2007 non Yoo et al. 2007]